MHVLVTGATGFVGSHVVDLLLERGHTVAYIARATSNLRWLEGKEAKRVDGNLGDKLSLQGALADVDVVIHVAGLTAARNEAEFLRGNRDSTQNLVDAVRMYRPQLQRFVHISSQAVCGPAADLQHPTTETMPLRPITAYGRTKKLAEDVIRAAMADFPCTIIRPPAVYGPRDEAILTVFKSVAKGVSPLIGFDEKRVSLVHVRDLARGIVDAAFNPAAAGQTYFISSDEFYAWPDITTMAAAVMGKQRIFTIRLPHFAVMSIAGISGVLGKLSSKPQVLDYEKGLDITQRYWICSTEKARAEIGYRQQVTLAEGIEETVAWYRAHGWL